MTIMTWNEAREFVNSRPDLFFNRDNSGKGWTCPMPGCGSGSGKTGTGMTTYDKGKHWVCWRGCFNENKGADVIDIIGKVYGLTEYADKLKKCCDIAGVTLDNSDYTNLIHSMPESGPGEGDSRKPEAGMDDSDEAVQVAQDNQSTDYTDLFLRANNAVSETNYWKNRGLTDEVINKNKLGFIAEWRHPKVSDKVPFSPRGIIPTSKYTYLARDIRNDDELNDIGKKYKKQKVGIGAPLYKKRSLQNDKGKPVFVMEGEIDALSVEVAGAESCALGSVANVELLYAELKKVKPDIPIIISMDFDRAGVETAKAIVEALNTPEYSHIAYTVQFISSPYKDANDFLVKDRNQFIKAVKEAELFGLNAKTKDRQMLKVMAQNILDYAAKKFQTDEELAEIIREESALQRESLSFALACFQSEIAQSFYIEPVPTGFSMLDRVLDGGLFPGLYTIGAVSSLGKTSLCLQMASHIAQAGNHVLYISMEMPTRDLQNKLISMFSFKASKELKFSSNFAQTASGVRLWARDKDKKKDAEIKVFNRAIELYEGIGLDRVHITEGIGDVSVSIIKEKIKRHLRLTGMKPVVIVDYMQIIAPLDIRASDKQNIDKAVLELKRISRDFEIPVICVSSFNRSSYDEPVNMTAFKESGAIEYSSDVLIGMQYDGMDFQEKEGGGYELQKDRDSRIRRLLMDNRDKAEAGLAQAIQCKILKNRNGKRGDCYMDFYPKFNYFQDSETESASESEQPANKTEWEGEGWKRL